jgi:hypothetical protein
MNDFDCEELIRFSLKLDDEADIEDTVFEKYGVDFETYFDIVSDLAPYAHLVQSPLTGKKYVGFADHAKGFLITKMAYSEVNA